RLFIPNERKNRLYKIYIASNIYIRMRKEIEHQVRARPREKNNNKDQRDFLAEKKLSIKQVFFCRKAKLCIKIHYSIHINFKHCM
ncbi:hypothetical protein, partial [Erwinia amylovora]